MASDSGSDDGSYGSEGEGDISFEEQVQLLAAALQSCSLTQQTEELEVGVCCTLLHATARHCCKLL